MIFKQKISEEICRKKYMINGETSVDDIFDGVAKEIASAEKTPELQQKWSEIFKKELESGRIMGGGRIMANARPYSKNKFYNNCFTVPFVDDLKEIYTGIMNEALIAQTGGGCGSNMSKIRPHKAPLSRGGFASGPISWMKVSNTSAKEIETGGSRRAAIIKLLADNHPDVISFATCKQGENTGLDQMNISVGITNKFMSAVENNEIWKLEFDGVVYQELPAKDLYDIIAKNAFEHNEPGVLFMDRVEEDNNSWEYKLDACNPCLKDDATVIKKDVGIIPLRELQVGDYIWSREGWTKVVAKFPTGNKEVFAYETYGSKSFESTENHEVEYNQVKVQIQYASAIDKFIVGKNITNTLPTEIISISSLGFHDVWDITVDNDSHTFWCQGFSISNCGEVTLPSDGGVCNLGSIVLHEFVRNPFEEDCYFDFKALENTVRIMVRFLDNAVDVSLFPLKFIENLQRNWRRLGIGFTSVGDTFVMLRTKYGSEFSVKLAEQIAQVICYTAYEESSEIAKEKGSFAKYDWDRIKDLGFIKKLPTSLRDKIKKDGLRNIALLTCAPTGCLVPETLISTHDGLLRLSEIIDSNINVAGNWNPIDLTIQNEYNDKQVKATKSFYNGYQPTKVIKTTSGIDLEGTFEHKFRVLENVSYVWKKMVDLVEGDKIVYKIGGYEKIENIKLIPDPSELHPNEKSITLPTEIDEKFSFFLGYYFAEGSNHKKGIRLNLEANSEEVVLLTHLIKEIFNWEVTQSTSRGCTSLYISSQRLLKFLKINGLLKNKSQEITIPLAIRKSSKISILSYIDAYFQGDGSQSGNAKYIDTCSYRNAQDIAVILRFVGINSKIRVTDKSLDSGSFSNQLSYRINFKKYGSVDCDSVDRYISRQVKEETALANNFGDNLFVDTVESIEDDFNLTLDIEVPETRTYIANSYISHNTTSMAFAQNCSSGIEPIFSYGFNRTIRTDGDNTKSEMVYDYAYLMYKEKFGEKELPEYFITTLELDPYKGIDVQAAFQKYIDNSISKTANLPKGYTFDQYKDLFMYAYKKGLKGFTSFNPEGSMKGILQHDVGEKNIGDLRYPVRPEVLPADVHHFTISKRKYCAAVGIKDGKPFEIFTWENYDHDGETFVPKSVHSGSINKRGKGKYVLISKEKEEYNLTNGHSEPTSDGLSRILSKSMRFDTPLHELVEELEKTTGPMTTFTKVLARTIKKYIPDGTKVYGETCPECGSAIIRMEGCLSCSSCTYSKCG